MHVNARTEERNHLIWRDTNLLTEAHKLFDGVLRDGCVRVLQAWSPIFLFRWLWIFQCRYPHRMSKALSQEARTCGCDDRHMIVVLTLRRTEVLR